MQVNRHTRLLDTIKQKWCHTRRTLFGVIDSKLNQRRNISFQKLLVKRGSRSEIMFFGRPCCRNTVATKRRANSSAPAVVCVGAKCVILLSRSTNTTIASCPLRVVGSWVIKSIDMLSHTEAGMGSGCSKPPGLVLVGLLC
ncbi:hypothetical protein VaNZ11_014836 [Volvox africanus]|uniref:Uncharacterized protein n=1 Tax=Volvox africanus TaxID=51714 RepID=A0ABQ5SJB7_9CHLO|nr:hypothetical protein VaNZ11_014836 [Volvox africanus]